VYYLVNVFGFHFYKTCHIDLILLCAHFYSVQSTLQAPMLPEDREPQNG